MNANWIAGRSNYRILPRGNQDVSVVFTQFRKVGTPFQISKLRRDFLFWFVARLGSRRILRVSRADSLAVFRTMPPVIKILILTVSMLGVMLLVSLSVMIWGIVIMKLRRRKSLDIPDFGPEIAANEIETIEHSAVQQETGSEESPIQSEDTKPTPVRSILRRELPPLGGMIPSAVLAFFWVGLVLLASTDASKFPFEKEVARQRILTTLLGTAVESVLVITLLSGMLLMFIRSYREKPVRELLGFSDKQIHEQLLAGALGFIAVLLPVYATIICTMSLRSDETMHPFLQLVKDSPPVVELALIALTAVVLAPLKEELLFRVILQPFLEHFLPAPLAIALVAALFAAVHEFPDSLSIVPLGLLLGYLFYKTRSYLVVVTLHSLFNGFNLSVLLLNTLVFPEGSPAG